MAVCSRLGFALIKPHLGSIEAVLQVIGVAIRESTSRIGTVTIEGDDDYRAFLVDSETDIIEQLLGTTFIVCQVHISYVISQVLAYERSAQANNVQFPLPDARKLTIMRHGSRTFRTTPHTEVEMIDAFANYFKHRDEWPHDWAQLSSASRLRARQAIEAAGAEAGSSGNLRAGSEALGNNDYHDTRTFARILSTWGERLVQTLFP